MNSDDNDLLKEDVGFRQLFFAGGFMSILSILAEPYCIASRKADMAESTEILIELMSGTQGGVRGVPRLEAEVLGME